MTKNQTIATAGEILVEFVSHRLDCGLEKIGDFSGPYPSGAPAIFLDQAARMGARTEMFGGVGDDGFGRSVLARLEQDGVGLHGIGVHPELSTGVAFVTYYADGHRDFIFHLTNTAAERIQGPTQSLDLSNTYLHVSAASLGSAAMRPPIMDLVRQVSAAGGKITCDPNARPELMRDSSSSAALNEVIELSYCLMPSTSDLGFLFPGRSEADAIEALLATKVEIIVLKRGAEGVTVIGNGERFDFEGHIVDEIDPTGAGDCFCGTFIALLAQGASLQQAAKMANAAGAIAVTRRGPMEGNSTPSEIETFLEQCELSA